MMPNFNGGGGLPDVRHFHIGKKIITKGRGGQKIQTFDKHHL